MNPSNLGRGQLKTLQPRFVFMCKCPVSKEVLLGTRLAGLLRYPQSRGIMERKKLSRSKKAKKTKMWIKIQPAVRKRREEKLLQ